MKKLMTLIVLIGTALTAFPQSDEVPEQGQTTPIEKKKTVEQTRTECLESYDKRDGKVYTVHYITTYTKYLGSDQEGRSTGPMLEGPCP